MCDHPRVELRSICRLSLFFTYSKNVVSLQLNLIVCDRTLSVVVEIHVRCILASLSWFGKLLFVEISSCVGAWHDTEGPKKKIKTVWSCLIVLERSILMFVRGEESRLQFVPFVCLRAADSAALHPESPAKHFCGFCRSAWGMRFISLICMHVGRHHRKMQKGSSVGELIHVHVSYYTWLICEGNGCSDECGWMCGGVFA